MDGRDLGLGGELAGRGDPMRDPALQTVDTEGAVGAQLVRAAGISTLGGVVARGLAFVVGIYMARSLTPFEFGSFGVLQTTVAMISTISGLALGVSATHYVASLRSEAPERAANVMRAVIAIATGSVLVASALVLLMAPRIANLIFTRGDLTTAVRVSGLQLVATVEFAAISGIILGLHRFGLASVAGVVQNAAILAGVMIAAPRFGLEGALLAHGVGIAIGVAIMFFSVRRAVSDLWPRTLARAVGTEWRGLARYSLPTLFGGLVGLPAGWASALLITRVQPDGFQQMAYFAAADRLRLVVSFVSGFFVLALFPVLSALVNNVDWKQSARGLELAIVGTAALVIPTVTALAFLGPRAMGIFGTAYERNWEVLLLILAWASAEAIGGLLSTALLAHGRQWFVFGQQTVFGLTLLSLAFFLRDLGGAGLAGAYAAATVGHLVIFMPWVGRMVRITRRGALAAATLLLVTALACFGSLIVSDAMRILAGVVSTTVAGVVALFLLTADERRRLSQRLGRESSV